MGQECKKKERQVHAFNKLRVVFFLNLSQPCSLMKQWKLDYLFLSNHYQIHMDTASLNDLTGKHEAHSVFSKTWNKKILSPLYQQFFQGDVENIKACVHGVHRIYEQI